MRTADSTDFNAAPPRHAQLSDVLITEELAKRPSRPPDHKLESESLVTVTQSLASDPDTILQRLVETAVRVCPAATTSGISLLDDNEENPVFYWPAVTGRLAAQITGSIPRNMSPCSVVVDRNDVQLFCHPERYYPYHVGLDPPTVEGLLWPFHVEGRPIGTLWVTTEDPDGRFDREDCRLLRNLTGAVSAGYQIQRARQQLEASVDAHRQTQTELKKANEKLEQLVEQRTVAWRDAQELAEQREREARRMDRLGLMSELASGIGHELNQPLAAVNTYAQGCMLRLDNAPPSVERDAELRDGLQHVMEEAGRCGRIINRLRDLTRLGEPSWSVERVEDLIKDIVELVRARAMSDQIELTMNVTQSLPPIVVGRVEIQQVLLNLLSNAIQAIEQAEDDGPKWVEVIAGRCGGDNVQITVRDSGPGATDAQIAEMFNPFFTTKPTGTGMGLNICETIIHHHGGHLWAERNRHRGLSMHIRLPLDTDEQ